MTSENKIEATLNEMKLNNVPSKDEILGNRNME